MLLTGLAACQSAPGTMFRLLKGGKTGVDFVLSVKPTSGFNIFGYMYFYQGGGAGTFNKDGLLDLNITANQTADRLI